MTEWQLRLAQVLYEADCADAAEHSTQPTTPLEWSYHVQVTTPAVARYVRLAAAVEQAVLADARTQAGRIRIYSQEHKRVAALLAELDAQRATVSILRDDSVEARTEARQYAEHAARLQTDLNAARAEVAVSQLRLQQLESAYDALHRLQDALDKERAEVARLTAGNERLRDQLDEWAARNWPVGEVASE